MQHATTTTTVKHLDHLNMTVRDLAASQAWYERVFGFTRVEAGVTEEGTPWAILRAGEAMLCLYEHPALESLLGPERRERGLHGLNHFALRITDRAAWEATCRREGLQVRYGGALEWPGSTSWYVLDPSGYEIEVVSWDDDQVSFP